mgnify:FL=1
MIGILRSHSRRFDRKPYQKSSVSSVCMHGGFYGDQTTGSYIAKLGEPMDTCWVTGSSAPCLSLFKPLWLIGGEHVTFSEDRMEDAAAYWKKQEELHRRILEHRIPESEYRMDRDRAEKSIMEKVGSLDAQMTDAGQRKSVMEFALAEEKKLQDSYLNRSEDRKPMPKGNPYYRHYWKIQNVKLRRQHL